MLLIRLFSRTFLANRSAKTGKYNTFIVKEIPKHLQLNDFLNIDKENYIDENSSKVINDEKMPKLKIQLIKIIKNKINMIRSKRRKGCIKRKGYKQLIGYFKVID
jgi:hypothetical protein